MSALPQNFTKGDAREADALRILLAEDDRLAALMLSDQLHEAGHFVEVALNGAEAYAMLREDPTRADLLITDRFMPMLDGLGLTRRILREPPTRHLPVVMLTGASDAQSIAEGLEAGVMQYLAKPVDPALLAQVLKAVRRQIEERRRLAQMLGSQQAGFDNIQRIDLHLRTRAEIAPVASLLASLSPHAQKIMPGLQDLIANAIEHGLYRLGGPAKRALLASGTLEQEMDKREGDPAYRGFVEAAAKRTEHGLRFAIRDPGPGFAWRQHLRPDPAQATSRTGRGLLRASLLFDEVQFHKDGNLVTATLRTRQESIW
ncbi:ATP-binding response regulator [Novosphingobium sp. MBES04]|uniref:ATP-binding response regulator n=1 Tax=Novosphingobium sp. MBES04 TaxID=1206458 RepID=UPI0006945F6D|nr:response regulator [Novosphingobium sp. MBES04]GAM06226.1 response regulator receiver domain-containing protein [Novosphingobium sp. MBES04]